MTRNPTGRYFTILPAGAGLLVLCVAAGCGDKQSGNPPAADPDAPATATAAVAPPDKPAIYPGPRWWAPGRGGEFPELANYENETGVVTTYNAAGPTDTAGHPFFDPIGTNGRACVSCHQPADGMSLSAATARERWRETNGTDPLFAAIDGANCPSLDQAQESSHSLLLDFGLIRVFRPWPPKDFDGHPMEPEFTIEVMRDPSSCNTDPIHGLQSATPMVSVYRRPRPTTNLKYITAVGFPFEPKNGLPLPLDPETGEPLSGNIMADGRARTLKEQAIDAMITHLEIAGAPDAAQLARIIAFESQLYTAQSWDKRGGSLNTGGVNGGPRTLAESRGGILNSSGEFPFWDEYEAWYQLAKQPATATDPQTEFRRSVGRGVDFFRNRTFLVTDNSGITSMNFGNPTRNDCNWCHNMYRIGNDVAPGQVDLGTTNSPFADPMPHLPLFRLTCKPGYPTHPHMGAVIYTVDPGYALTTGKCIDIGKITVQSMRSLAARAPYFANGFAPTIRAIVDYYDRRYYMKMTEQEKEDLTNLMSVL